MSKKKGGFEIKTPEKNHSASLDFHHFQSNPKTSALNKYQSLFVGNRGLWSLFKYEVLTCLLMNRPGMLGFFLRQKLYRFLLKNKGKGVVIAAGVAFRQPGKISLGDDCVIDELVRVSVSGQENSRINLGKNVFVGRGSILNVRDGLMEISDFTTISSYCRIATGSCMRIGQYVLIAAYCYIGGGNHKADNTNIPMALQAMEEQCGVTIGDDVWIGAHTTISDGVTIGNGSIIGSMSFVNKDIPEYSIAYGCPARVHKRRA